MASFSKWVDTHCHFDDSIFDPQASTWLELSQNLYAMIVPGVSPDSWDLMISKLAPLVNVYWAVGVHPWWAEKASILPDDFGRFFEHPRCIALGECGLDGAIALPMDQQLSIFEQQVRWACDLKRPLIIHAHKAHSQVLKVLAQHRPQAGGVIHAFAGSFELAMQYWRKGFYLGIGGVITYERAKKTRATVARLPLEAILLETDAPYMPLCGYQGQANSPGRVIEVARQLAELREVSPEQIAQQTFINAQTLFGFQYV